MSAMQPTSPTAAPRRTSLDEFIRANTTPFVPVFGMGCERQAIAAAAAQAGEVVPAPSFAAPVLAVL